jgi:hypothetical protein
MEPQGVLLPLTSLEELLVKNSCLAEVFWLAKFSFSELKMKYFLY